MYVHALVPAKVCQVGSKERDEKNPWVQLTLMNCSSLCPRAFTAMPAHKSRYLFPSVSHIHTPLPWLNTKLGRAYTGSVYALAFSMNGAAEADGVEGFGWVTATYRFDGEDCGKMCVSVVRTVLSGCRTDRAYLRESGSARNLPAS